RPVDLVDEHEVREDRPGPEVELAALRIEDGQARDVGRLQVRRALDPRARRPGDAADERAGEDGLRRAGGVLEEDVAATGEGREDELDLVPLAADDGGDVVEEALRRVGRELEGRVRLVEKVRLRRGHPLGAGA